VGSKLEQQRNQRGCITRDRDQRSGRKQAEVAPLAVQDFKRSGRIAWTMRRMPSRQWTVE
jgi:hypothetical protein